MRHMRPTRRQALKASAAAATGYWMGTQLDTSRADAAPNEKLNLAVIGIGGQGGANLRGVSSQNIVALCDVDGQRGKGAFEKYQGSKTKKYDDYRKMLDELEGHLDGIVVSTPDHTHFHAAMSGMVRGLHCYCEKPMAHNVWQVREMTKIAAEKKLATQLGVQRHTIGNVHRVVELIKTGAIGDVTEVHSWVGGSRGMPGKPTDFPAVPSHLKWDLWLGQTPERKYSPAYCPYNWRFWWDYGTGETGNWGCHILDIPFWALDLKYPTKVTGSGPDVDDERTPKAMATSMEFPGNTKRPGVKLHWYHSSAGPDILREKKLSAKGNNTLFIGTDGMLLCGFTQRKLYPEEKFADFKRPDEFIPNSPGFHKEWITACKGGEPATCDFAYSGPLTETVLLGNVAYRAGDFDWDAKSLKTVGNDKAMGFIKESVRKGWEI